MATHRIGRTAAGRVGLGLVGSILCLGLTASPALAAPTLSINDPETTANPDATATWYDGQNKLCVADNFTGWYSQAVVDITKPDGTVKSINDPFPGDGVPNCYTYPKIKQNETVKLKLCFTQDDSYPATWVCKHTTINT